MLVGYLEAPPAPSARARGALVFLHAFPLTARMFDKQLALAERGWHVIVPKLRGFDGTVPDPPASSVDDYAGDVVDLLDSLHVEDAVVGGVSMGGYIAFAMLRLAPTYIRGLVLADTKATSDTPEGIEGRKKMLQLVREKGAAGVADEMIPKLLGETTRRMRPDLVDEVRAMVHANSVEAIAGAIRALKSRPDSTPLLPTIHMPTLIVVGEEDTITPKAAADEMHRAIAGSQLTVVPAAGHLANFERPDAFNAALAQFLDHRV